jgi:hypothetical protein
MMHALTRWASRTAVGLLVFLVSACGSGAPEATPTPVDPRALLERAAREIQAVDSLRFKLQLTGAPAFIDTANIISFVAADGSYAAPDRVQARVSAAVLGVPGQIDVVAAGDDQYYRHILLTGNRWIAEPFSPGFNADRLIRADDGIRRALESLRDVVLVGREDLFGTPVYHISGQASVIDISAVTVGLIRGTGDALASIYIHAETGRVERMVLIQPETASEQHPEPTTWTMELFDYNDPGIVIEVPAVEAEPGTESDTSRAPFALSDVPGALRATAPMPTAEATRQP